MFDKLKTIAWSVYAMMRGGSVIYNVYFGEETEMYVYGDNAVVAYCEFWIPKEESNGTSSIDIRARGKHP